MGDRTQRDKRSEPDDEEIKDFWCDPENPRTLKFEEVSAAAYMVRDGVVMTPCDRSHMNSELGLEMYFKKDYMQVVIARDTKGPVSGGPQSIPGQADISYFYSNFIFCAVYRQLQGERSEIHSEEAVCRTESHRSHRSFCW